MAKEAGSGGGFFSTLPGLITALSSLIVAVGGIITIFVHSHKTPKVAEHPTTAAVADAAAPSPSAASMVGTWTGPMGKVTLKIDDANKAWRQCCGTQNLRPAYSVTATTDGTQIEFRKALDASQGGNYVVEDYVVRPGPNPATIFVSTQTRRFAGNKLTRQSQPQTAQWSKVGT